MKTEDDDNKPDLLRLRDSFAKRGGPHEESQSPSLSELNKKLHALRDERVSLLED